MPNNMYWASALTGGASGALDAIDGASLADGDAALVLTSTGGYLLYFLNATSGQAESSPDIIAPDTNPGTKRWILTNLISPRLDANEVRAKSSNGLKLMDNAGTSGIQIHTGGIIQASKQPAARAYRSSAQSINASSATKVNFNSESYDVSGNFDSASSYRFTVPANGAGKYLVVVAIATSTIFSVGGTLDAMIYKNGSEHSRCRQEVNIASPPGVLCVDILDLAVSDYIEGWVYHTNSSSIQLQAGSNYTYISICKLW